MKTDHYENINRLLAKALAHGVDSEETRKAITRDAINMYVETQIKKEKVQIELNTNDTLNNLDKSYILKIAYGLRYVAYPVKKATPKLLLKITEKALNMLLQK